jgi:FkbM family methyltransferase
MRDLIKLLIPDRIKRFCLPRDEYRQPSYAQEGEDRILSSLLGLSNRDRKGFYVDVGAHHPRRYSNTFLFYLYGWSGINIDAMPGSMRLFQLERPRDINIEAAVADEVKMLTFYEFNEPALNGFCREIASGRDQYRGWKIINERQIMTVKLKEILEQHLSDGQAIDFLSVDVEGLDLHVLRSNDWDRFRPAVVLIEDSDGMSTEQGDDSKITIYMKEHGYKFCCKTLLTTFFVDRDRIEHTPLGLRLRQEGRSGPVADSSNGLGPI